jgi:hypothetical protein
MDCDGIGAFFYPIVLVVTDKERIDYQDSELNKPPGYGTRKIVIDHSLQDNTRIVVTDDGYLGILKNNVAKVQRILNMIFATGITFGVGSEFVREKDLCRFKENGDSKYIRLEEIGGPSKETCSISREIMIPYYFYGEVLIVAERF